MKLNKNRVELELARNKITAKQLAAAMGVSSSTIHRAVTGGILHTSTVGRIAEALNVPVERIIEQEE